MTVDGRKRVPVRIVKFPVIVQSIEQKWKKLCAILVKECYFIIQYTLSSIL